MDELVCDLAEALATAIDAKGGGVPNLRRKKVLAAKLGEALGMTGDEIAAVEMAALLHDVGTLAVPESISCPGQARSPTKSSPQSAPTRRWEPTSSHACRFHRRSRR